ncbi:glycosyltransferase family 15 protein [Phellopilus nigrolimitatus]|nr:glycosyltransferase family 15 protein [Phellopilus nigrolimitatus]
MLVRNSEVNDASVAIRQLQDRFNNKYKYPWVFLNDEPFSEYFIQRTSQLVGGANASYGVIPQDHWQQPEWIDENRAREGRNKLMAQGVIYGGKFLLLYRNMCRFNSGFFYRHELLQQYRYYWRVEPGVKFFCDMDYDPFLMMQDQQKVYSFTISLYEWHATIPTLWPAVKEFIKEYPQHLAENNSMDYLSNDGGETYNLCHFWSNFEIADLDFWRSPAYTAFFDFLEKKGGFYYERWGDAPVHSIAAALFARKDQIHFFRDVGYRHDPFQRCPQNPLHQQGNCWCDPTDSFDYRQNSCVKRWEDLQAGRT